MNLAKSLTTLNMALASAAALAGAGTPPEDRIRAADEKYAALFAAERTPSATDPEFMNILQHFIFGEVFRIGELDDATRELITVVSLTTLQALPQLKAHVVGNLRAGNGKETMLAAIVQAAPYVGLPAALSAVSVIKDAEIENYAPIYGE